MSDSTIGEDDSHHLELRNLVPDDYPDIRAIMDEVYRQIGGSWTKKEYLAQLERFPEGQIGIVDNGKVVAAVMSVIVNYAKYGDRHTYWQITGDGKFTTHDPKGDSLYGVDIFIHPEWHGLRLGRRLYDARKELCESLNLKRIILGARMPGYGQHADELKPSEYLRKVQHREIYDPVLSFQLANDFHVRRLVRNYLPEDTDSRGWAVILEWLNIFHEEDEPLIGAPKAVVRVGALQWQMRPTRSLEHMYEQIEYFVDAVSGYQADFAVFPEFFVAPLMGIKPHDNPASAIRGLAAYSEDIRVKLSELAVSYNVNIIAGSMPEYDGEALYNVSLLCRRDGSCDKQYKLHITPDEKHYWGLQGGQGLNVFDTDAGRIGILICYDAEFPELPRLLADEGLQILFVPYWTDTKNGYLRVRRCSQARAVENECYVVITGSCGNLPQVENMDIQYSQSAVFSPSDFSFPHDAIVAEATPNTEMALIVDLDLDLLKQLHSQGSVRNLLDRRADLYELKRR